MRSFGRPGFGASDEGVRSCSARADGPDASRFVKAVDGSLVAVTDIDPADRYARGPYSCLSCGHLMVPALGRTRRHHFKHKAGRPSGCHNETYLHQLAKLTLYESLKEALRAGTPYWLTRERPAVCSHYQGEFGFSCTSRSAPYQTDLTEAFDKVELEAGVDGFVADVLLSSSSSPDRLLLEVAVSHPCDEGKIACGLPIIEIEVRNEDGAEALKDGINGRSAFVSCHNLPEPEPAPHLCDAPCPATGLALLLYDNGKAWFSGVGIGQDQSILSDGRLVAHEVVDVRLGRHSWDWWEARDHLREFLVRQVFEEGRHVRSCMLCWNNGGRLNDHDIRCLAKERRVWMSTGASACAEYEPAEDADEVRRIFHEQLR